MTTMTTQTDLTQRVPLDLCWDADNGAHETIPIGRMVAELSRLREAARVLLARADGVIHSDKAGNRFRKVFALDLEELQSAYGVSEEPTK